VVCKPQNRILPTYQGVRRREDGDVRGLIIIVNFGSRAAEMSGSEGVNLLVNDDWKRKMGHEPLAFVGVCGSVVSHTSLIRLTYYLQRTILLFKSD
jgi:hypothetical protein